jgi:GDP/UDP-N,N'-diacetylbacillosamine 2-epimerase (hydrolysing)
MPPRTLLRQCHGRLRVLALTAIRSEYDLLHPLLKAMHEDPVFDVGVIAAGAHLTKLHRHSVRLVEADGFRIAARIRNLRLDRGANTTAGRVQSAARLLTGLSEVLTRENPDLLIYLGDREEPLMAAVAANYLGIPAVHIAGGDNAHPAGGDVDEEARHATTKLSHLHLTMAPAHTRRILRLGEEPWRVRTVGNPGLDRLRLEPDVGVAELCRAAGGAAAADYLILIYHAVSSGLRTAPRELELCLRQCLDTGLEVFVGSPNSDPGFEDLLRVVHRFSRNPQIHPYQNLPRSAFVRLLKGAKAVVGNSSMGLLEASFVGVPCVNVGQRQRGRLAGANVQFVDADPTVLRNALRKALTDRGYRARVRRAKSPYGDGFMVPRTLKILKSLPSRERLLAKAITY